MTKGRAGKNIDWRVARFDKSKDIKHFKKKNQGEDESKNSRRDEEEKQP